MEAAASGCAVILCGDEGYLGILEHKTETRAVLGNLCCRGEGRADAFLLERDLRCLLDDEGLRRRCGAYGREIVSRFFVAEKMCAGTQSLYRRIQRPNGKRLLIGGYFGCKNAGDDAILTGFLEGIRALSPMTSVCALTASPRRSKAKFGIPCVGRKNPIAIFLSMWRADAFLCGGGSLLQNATSARSLRYYLFLLRMAKRMGCKTVLYSAGIGPLLGERARGRVVRVLRECDYISLRDANSRRLLEGLGIDRAKLHGGADPALLMSVPPPTRGAAILSEQGIERERRLLCVVLRHTPLGTSHLWKSVVTAVDIVCRRLDLMPILLCFCGEDADTVEAASGRLHAPVVFERGVGDLFAILSECRAVVTMRLHAMILATAVATPALGVVTDPSDGKISSFASASGQQSILYPAPSVGELCDRLERMISDPRGKNEEILLAATVEMQKNARKDLANIHEMLYNKGDMT